MLVQTSTILLMSVHQHSSTLWVRLNFGSLARWACVKTISFWTLDVAV